MQSYAKYMGKKNFNWHKFLSGRIIEDYTLEKLKKAESKANCWVTCACGSQCKDIDRWSTGCPKDDQLRRLGGEFSAAIEAMKKYYMIGSDVGFLSNLNKAKRLMFQIEARSEHIIKRMKKAYR